MAVYSEWLKAHRASKRWVQYSHSYTNIYTAEYKPCVSRDMYECLSFAICVVIVNTIVYVLYVLTQ